MFFSLSNCCLKAHLMLLAKLGGALHELIQWIAWLHRQVLLLLENFLLGLTLLINSNLVWWTLELIQNGYILLSVHVLHSAMVTLVITSRESWVALFVERVTSIMDHDTLDLRRSLRSISWASNVTILLLQKLTLAEISQIVISLVS